MAKVILGPFPFDMIKGQAKTFFARVQGDDGNDLTVAGVSSVTAEVQDAAGTQKYNASLVVNGDTGGGVVFTTLQTGDSRWDTTRHPNAASGYNFRATIPRTAFDAEGRYTVEFSFVQATGSNPVKLQFDGSVRGSAI